MSDIQVDTEEMFERVDDAFFALDEDWRFTFLNDSAAELIDVDREAVLGERIWDEFPEAVDTTFQTKYEEAMETETQVTFEEYYPPLERWFEVNAYPGANGLSVYFRDVTQRVEREQELKRYEAIVETAQDGIYTVDEDGYFTMANEAYVEMTGYEREELVGSHVSKVVDQSVVNTAATLDEELKAGEETAASLEASLERKDGTSFEAEATFAIAPTGDRVGIVRDISAQKRREQQLQQYESIVETIEDGVYALDSDERFLLVNDAFCEMTGYDRSELLGEHVTKVKAEWVVETANRLVSEVASGDREEGKIEFEIQPKEGDPIPVESRLKPLDLDEGTGRCGVVRDVSERREREEELRRRIEQQAVVTRLGERALEDPSIDALMSEASRLVAEALEMDYCKVLDLDADGEELLLRQGVGWRDGIVGSETVSAVADDSQAAYTLSVNEPVAVESLDSESRFSGPDLLTSHDVSSGISTIIGSDDDPWGILGTHDTDERTFTEQDVNFVQAVANVLGATVRRHQDEKELRTRNDRLAALNDIDSLVHSLAESLFGLSSKPEIEALVCDRLEASDSYEFAWIGEEADGEIEVSTASGVEDYLADITLSLEEGPSRQGPTVQAHETGEMQIVQNVQEDPRYEPWRERGREYGYRASAAIPIANGGEHYGTLNVYSSRNDAFSEEERDALGRLGSIIAYAMKAVERDRKLQRERDRLEFMNRLLRHNLLNSLNVVEARLDLLEGRVDYEVSEYLETAAERTAEMIDFVETVREVTKVISRGDEQELRPIEVDDVLAERVDRARKSYPEAEFHLEQPPSVEVVADDLLGEVVDNILVNAVQHNDTESPTVWVDTTVTDDEVVIAVADDGPGIADERKPRVFDREATGFANPGSGFGLYLVKEIVESYDGDTDVTDSTAGGARFEITLKRA